VFIAPRPLYKYCQTNGALTSLRERLVKLSSLLEKQIFVGYTLTSNDNQYRVMLGVIFSSATSILNLEVLNASIKPKSYCPLVRIFLLHLSLFD